MKRAMLFATACLAVGPVLAQVDNEGLNAVVAKVHTHGTNGSDAYASAIYVGSNGQTAYFITANHALRNGSVLKASTVELQFRTSPDSVPATVLDPFTASEDLAALSAPVGKLPRNLAKLTVIEAKSNTEIQTIGQPAAGDWSTWRGTVQNENVTSSDIYHFATNSDSSLAGGYSGGLVLDASGNFLGMHTETEQTYGVALKATIILRHLIAWNVPHDNLVVQTGTITPPPNTFPVYVVSRHAWIDNKKLGEVTSGTITISIDGDAFSYEHHTQDYFTDQQAELTAGPHQVTFAVDVHVVNFGRSFRVKTTCIQPFQISGTTTLEPHIKFDDRGAVVSCGLSPLKK